ncbi:MAG: hypothetical protein ACR2PT_19225 [Endozoicomonas sp.]
MKVTRKEQRFLRKVLADWHRQGLLDSDRQEVLSQSLEQKAFDWQRLARYSFWSALACILISMGAVVMDARLLEIIRELFNSPPAIKSLFFFGLAVAVFWVGLNLRHRKPDRVFSQDAVFFLGVVAIASSIAFLGETLDSASGHFSLLLLLAAVAYGVIGLCLSSRLVWLFCLLSLGCWFGAETGYISGWGSYYLGMNYPLRFVLFGGALVLFSYLLFGGLTIFQHITRVMGLLYLFIALWILSIFGNYGDMEIWLEVKQYELLHWSVMFGLASFVAIAVGLKFDDRVMRGFGLVFLFINLYTRFFELCWDNLHKALFFSLLGISLWLLGHYAETIWLSQVNRTEDSASKE